MKKKELSRFQDRGLRKNQGIRKYSVVGKELEGKKTNEMEHIAIK